MSKKISIKALLLLIVFSVSAFSYDSTADAGDSSGAMTSQMIRKFTETTTWLKQSNLEITASPDQAFISDYILVFGEGLPSANAKTPAEKRLTATRAAEVMAYRQLAVFLSGFAIAGDTLVRDASLQYDIVRTTVSGTVRGAQKVYQEYSEREGSAIVVVKMDMKGDAQSFSGAIYEKLLGNPQIGKAVFDPQPSKLYKQEPVAIAEKYDGLIIDARAFKFRPALINKIYAARGDVLYDPSKLDKNLLVEQGCGVYANSINKAKDALKIKGVNNPLIVEANGTITASNLKISDEDSQKTYSANQTGKFFDNAKVAFVVK